MPAKPKTRTKSGGSTGKHDTSGQSSNSSYRDSSQYDEAESSQDSSPRSVKNDSQDEVDFVSHTSTSYSEASQLEVSSDRGSPYSKLLGQVNDLSAQYEMNASPAFQKLHISPDFRKRAGKSAEEFESLERNQGPSPRRPIHTYDSSSPVYKTPPSHFPQRKRDFSDGRENEESHGTESSKFQQLCWICIIFVIALCYIFFIHPVIMATPIEPQPAGSMSDREILVQNFDLEFKKFMQLFPAQSRRFWKILKASTKRVLGESEPRMPVVLIVVSNEGAHDSAACITKKFAEVIVKVYGVQSPLEIHNRQVLQYSGDEGAVKKFLDVSLQEAFGKKTRVAVIHDIDKIPGDAAMIFHSYCDNEFAPYKDAAILFTIQNQGETLLDDSDVENYLDGKWEEQLDKDKRGALIYSRIANNIAFVAEENENVIDSVCPP